MSTKNVSRSIWRKVQKMPSVEGVFGINKPTGLSSAQVLRDCQKVFHDSKLFAPHLRDMKAQLLRDNHNQRQRRKVKDPKVKIGHGGTLDPLATGILIAGIGTGTKSLQDFLLCTKTYEAVVLFGTGTDSYDRLGKVLTHAPTEHITKEMVEKALDQFRGKFMQLPPLFSALKMNGKPLYEYARENKPIPRDIERRPVEVEELEMLEWMEPGTHNHKPPTDEAGHAEINLAKLVWKQESILPPKSPESEKVAKENFEDKKRKMSENQDELVQERPKSKRKTDAVKTESDPDAEPVMSGGLPEPVASTEVAAKVPDATVESVEAAPESPKSLGPPAARIRMTVTSGFYVRSLCHDLGVAVGSAALMAELERTRQGQFSVGNDNVLEYDDLSKGEEVWAPKLESMIKAWENKTEATKAEAGAEAKSEAPVKEEVSGDAVKMEDAQAKFTEAAEQLAEEVKSEGESPSKVFEAAA
ncbi:Pseudouridine synthase [Glarea lozoyensis ATCC 20868]|uniref:tRNA pseudouridine(55) synthase n=1 Tax=Glarea lozoyensis (strain ATCC 20868 / MF5171) TaxID=1116229 RepID=S3E5G8_GLAL2|nr:Pseudouridine synthase [Glarea lozoyensis ATCC 20868]EPE33643.1 Pseudouridine synthase [Glarea lozoyensis ATCC 20868]